MTDTTSERSSAIQAAAQRLLASSPQPPDLRLLAHALADETGCVYDTAKRHLRKAIKAAQGEPLPKRGGSRGGGWPLGMPRKKQDKNV